MAGVVFLEGAESISVTGDELEGAVGLVAGEVVLGHDTADDVESAIDLGKAGGRELGKAGLVNSDTIDDVFFEDIGSPNTEIGGLAGVDAVADRDDGVEIVDIDGTGDGAGAFGGNLFHFGTSSRFFELPFLVDFFEMFGDSLRIDVEQFGDLSLSSPNSFRGGFEVELDGFAAGFVDDDVVHGASLG